ncbi:MAG: endolytic transglycosylase MltG [Gammaproteobacteria bacterium]
MLKKVLLVLAVVVVAGLAGVYWLYQDIQRFADEPMALPAGGASFELTPGTGVFSLANRLQTMGWIADGRYFRAMARLDKTGASMKAGEYHIPEGTSPRALINLFNSGRVKQYKLTVPEGWTIAKFLALLKSEEQLKKELTDAEAKDLPKLLGMEEPHPEGLFFPDTYVYTNGSSDRDILLKAYRAMKKHMAESWAKRAPDTPLKSAYEALILASIVEKETGAAHERPEIAGVFIRRLNKGMRLQTDPTVIYGIGPSFDGNITRKHLKTDTPYNTYTRGGLPPTPIALPGRAALDAAVNPAEGKSLYFVSRGDGTHQFSNNLKDHNRAVRQYQLRRGKK